MKLIKNTTWGEIFENWKNRESNNPDWIECATKIKGWPDWKSWRNFTAQQIDAENRNWQIYKLTNPAEEISSMLIGPYSSWQNKVINKNNTTFEELLDIPEQYKYFSQHNYILKILSALPFSTELIGIIREDNSKIVCIEGHHRATAITLAKKQKTKIDFKNAPIQIALTNISRNESFLFDDALKRGTFNLN